MASSAYELFSLIDDTLSRRAGVLTNRLLTESGQQAWTSEQRDVLESIIREELDTVVWAILNLFDNVGCVLPEDVDGWTLHSKTDGMDIRIGNLDYSDMWLEHHSRKGRLPH